MNRHSNKRAKNTDTKNNKSGFNKSIRKNKNNVKNNIKESKHINSKENKYSYAEGVARFKSNTRTNSNTKKNIKNTDTENKKSFASSANSYSNKPLKNKSPQKAFRQNGSEKNNGHANSDSAVSKPFQRTNFSKAKTYTKTTYTAKNLRENIKAESFNTDIRIGKFLAALGLCSRREAAVYLQTHEVLYNDKKILVPNFYLHNDDVLKIDGKEYRLQEKQIYLLHKPAGYVCSHRSFKNQPSIFELLPSDAKRFYFAGRLDADSQGLVVISNDGDLVYRLTHPSQKTIKKYLVHCSRPLSLQEQKKLLQGVYQGGERLKADSIEKHSPAHYLVELHTGRNREVRRMMESLNIKILALTRLAMGEFALNDIPKGEYQPVKAASKGNKI